MEIQVTCVDSTFESGLSPDFIRAVAQLLETDPEEILAELGRRGTNRRQKSEAARQQAQYRESELQISGYYLG